jgi:RNA polymerase sigma-70 factor, ECF subfamily
MPPDDRELSSWIREYTPRLLAVAHAFADEEAEAEDILQDVWIRAADHAHRRPEKAPLGAWLHVLTLNVGRSHRRRVQRRQWLRMRWAADLGRSIGETPTVEPEGVPRTRLWRAVAALPKLQRDVVLLRVVDGLSTREAAARMDRAEGTVKASLYRALQTLRRALGSNDGASLATMNSLDHDT